MKPLRNLLAIGTALFAASAWAADPLRMDVEPTFSGNSDTSVMTVVLENDGPDARGTVRVTGESGETSYPVELPRGARKKLLTLPEAPWGEVVFTLETDHGDVTRKIPAIPTPTDFGGGGGTVLLVGDDNGGLGFLRKLMDGKVNLSARDTYVTPEEAPDRPAAFRAISVVMLGPGSERLPDGAVKALKDYVISGGSIVFLGGASAPVLEDKRWADVLPGSHWRPKTLASSSVLSDWGDASLSQPFTVLTADEPSPSATIRYDNGTALETERGFGLGRIVVLGYSPLEPPLSTWAGRGKAVARFLRPADVQRARSFIAMFQETGSMDQPPYVPAAAPAGSPAPAMPTYTISRASSDPFSTTLPPTGTVFGILAGYFILVVPASFLVLRKLKKGELAWFTAPILSLGFAGLLFKSAEGLYSASLSTATTGVLVAQEGTPGAMFFGASQLFFPRGGVYDLKLSGVDRMAAVQQDYYYSFGARPTLQGFNTMDVGEIKAPELEADNLAFRDLSYSQRVTMGDWFRFSKINDHQIRVENRSPYRFEGTLVNGRFEGPLVKLESGQSKVLQLGVGNPADGGQALNNGDIRNFTRTNHRIALNGSISGFRPGPQIGKEISDRSGITLVAFAKETTQ